MGCWGAGADYQLPSPPRAATSVPHNPSDRVPFRSPSPRRPAPPERQASRQLHCAPHGFRDPHPHPHPTPGPAARPIPRSQLRAGKPQVGGRRGAHLRRRRGALGASGRRGGGGHVVGQRRRLLLPGIPLSPPRLVPPAPKRGTCRGKVRLRLGNAWRSPAPPARPPRAPSPPPAWSAAPARCPPGPVRGGRAWLR